MKSVAGEAVRKKDIEENPLEWSGRELHAPLGGGFLGLMHVHTYQYKVAA